MDQESIYSELYIPRKCDSSGAVIHSKDHAAVQLNICKLDKDGVMIQGEFETFSIGGAVRKSAQADAEINRICIKRKIVRNVLNPKVKKKRPAFGLKRRRKEKPL